VNRFVDTLNRIRQRVSVDWLTPSQRAAYERLREQLEFLDEVNLWGAHGTGKTFIGWVLDRQGLAAYAARSESVEPASVTRVVVVDNSDWRRRAVRDALHRCREYGYGKVVLISTEPVQEQMASCRAAAYRQTTCKRSLKTCAQWASPLTTTRPKTCGIWSARYR
jgi:hypothetical protein